MVAYTVARDPDFSDIDLSLTKSRRNKDLYALRGVDAIMTSVENLVNLNFYEKPYKPQVGSSVRKLLFDNVNQLTATFIEQAITEVIRNFEPRVSLIAVVVKPAPDNNRYDVSIIFRVVNFEQPVEITMYLNRVR